MRHAFAVRAGLALAIAFGPACAGERLLPVLAVEQHCGSVAELMAGSKAVLLTCLKLEQESYERLKVRWPQLSLVARAACTSHVSSYQYLAACVEREMAAEQELKEFKFRW